MITDFRQLLAVDKNLYYNQKHLENILNGTQNQYLEKINDPMNVNSYPIDVLKRKEWVRQNQESKQEKGFRKNGMDMIGTGNLFDSSKVETIIARDKYFQNKFHQKGEFNEQSTGKDTQSQTQNHESGRRSEMSRQSHVRESMEEGWGPDVMQRQRRSMHAKEHNDQLFKKKSVQRKSLGYGNMGQGTSMSKFN